MKYLIRIALFTAFICLMVAAYQLATAQVWNSRLLLIALSINGLILGYHNRKNMGKS